MNSNTIIRPSSREQWLEVRSHGIGSSEVATIVGLNPYETPYQLWRRKIGLDPAKAENQAMRNGHHLEDAVARMWADANPAREIIKRSAIDWIIRDNERPYMQVSPDRTFWLGESRSPEAKGILEIKTTRQRFDGDDLPKNYFCQVQYQLGVARLTQGSLAWLQAGPQGFLFDFKDLTFVPDFYDWLVEEIERFWVDNIKGGQEPAAVNAADILLKFARHTDGKVAEVNEATFEAYGKLKEVRAAIDELDKTKEEYERQIKLAFADAEAISYQGTTLATFKAPRPSERFDLDAFKADHPDLVANYTRPKQGSRRLLIK